MVPNFNAGVEVAYKIVNDENPALLSPSRNALSGIGPKIKWQPLPKLGSLTLQSTFLFPIADSLEGNYPKTPYLSYDGYNFWNQLFFDRKFTPTLNLFLGADAIWNIDRDGLGHQNTFSLSGKVIPSWFPNPKTTVYGLVEYSPSLRDGEINSYFIQGGVGAKYQLSSNWEIEGLVTKFVAGVNAGAGQTFNLGIRHLGAF